MIKKFDKFISEGVMTNTLRRFHTGGVRKEDSVIAKRKNRYESYGKYHAINGYDGWYLSFDCKNNICIFNIDSDYEVCEYTSEYGDDDRPHLAVDTFKIQTRSEMYGDDDDITDEEEEIINSEEFYTAIDKTINKIPLSYFEY